MEMGTEHQIGAGETPLPIATEWMQTAEHWALISNGTAIMTTADYSHRNPTLVESYLILIIMANLNMTTTAAYVT